MLNSVITFGVTQGHQKLHHLTDRIRVPIGVSQNYGPMLYSFRDKDAG